MNRASISATLTAKVIAMTMPKLSPVLAGAAALLALVFFCAPPARAALTGIARVSNCIQDDFARVCEDKDLVTVELSAGNPVSVDVAYLSSVTPGTLEETVTFNLTKSRPQYLYPLRYLHSVAAAPAEALIKVANSRPGVSACRDGAADVAPTCGWQLDAAGEKIPDSQGFCSNRDLLQLKSGPAGLWRGEAELGGASTLADSFAIAHCLRPGPLTYAGFEIGPPAPPNLAVTINVIKGTTVLNTFTLSPEAPIYLQNSGIHQARVALLGDRGATISPPELAGQILYIPVAPADDPRVQDPRHNMLLVPRELVSLDGGECDKVGAGYAAFRRQAAAAATSRAGACLANQLADLLAADEARLAAGKQARYLVSGRREFAGTVVADNTLRLLYNDPQESVSTVRLEFDAAQIGQTINESAAYIDTASVAPFAALSGDGTLAATIVNIGNHPASYLVTVSNCTPGIIPPPPRAVTIAPGPATTLNLELATAKDLSGAASCDVALLAPTGYQYDQVKVNFTLTGVVDLDPRELQAANSRITVGP